jgi:superoxide dismutase, Cu-Zn family
MKGREEMRHGTVFLRVWAMGLAVLACACVPPGEVEQDEIQSDAPLPVEEREPVTHAVALLHPTEGHEARGAVHFVSSRDEIRVTAIVEGLSPGLHGFHVHEYGDCSAPDGSSAGGHFDPGDMAHGAPTAGERHVGDLGNLSADEMGVALVEWTDTLLAFTGPRSILGRAVIVHAQADDLRSQPTGESGARVACGVIGIAQGDL